MENNNNNGNNPGPFVLAEANASMLNSELSKHVYADKGGRMPGTQPFSTVFEQELDRVVKAVNQYQQELECTSKSLLTSAEITADQIGSNNKQRRLATIVGAATAAAGGNRPHDKIHSLTQQMEEFVENCLELQNRVTKSRMALLGVAQKADNQLQTTQCTQLLKSSFPSTLNSVLVVVASDIYATICSAEKKLNEQTTTSGGSGEDDGVWKAPSSFQRTTTKYYVKEEQLTKLLLTCAGEAPLLVYGKKGTLTSKSNRRSRVSEGDKLWSSMVTPITSVYFDSADMSMYMKRLARIEGAQLLRARWYGNQMPKGDGIIFLELKTHHEKWVANKSVKERAAVQERDMKFFLQPIPWTTSKPAQDMILRASPTLTGEELTKSTNLLLRMHKLVVKYNLRSCVRSVYIRAAFQSAKSNGTSCVPF
jgi:SPX domain protein involved in polyphosphate accumulation